jgi:hypothetical protein
MLSTDIGTSRYEQINKDILYFTILFTILFTFMGLIIDAGGLVNAQEQQQVVLSETLIGNFTLNIDVLGVNSETRNSTISLSGPEGESLTSNTTIDLFCLMSSSTLRSTFYKYLINSLNVEQKIVTWQFICNTTGKQSSIFRRISLRRISGSNPS